MQSSKENETTETNGVGGSGARARVIRLLFVALGCLAGCAVLSLAARTPSRVEAARPAAAEPNCKVTAPPAVPAARQSKSQPAILPGHALTLTPHGFEPGKIIRSAGPFVIAVIGQSGTDTAFFVLSDDLGNQIRTAQVPKETPTWADTYNLIAGHYMLREAGHPDWVCDITIN